MKVILCYCLFCNFCCRLVHKMPTRKDPAWKYGVEVETEWTTQHIRCNFCENIIKGGVTRMRQHLSGDHPTFPACTMVPAEVRDEIKRYMKEEIIIYVKYKLIILLVVKQKEVQV
ncbi:hypothetical protein ACOSQ3_004185 [Xanthoceras sorbifolium]